MEYIIRFSEVPTTQQVEEALKKSKPMALSKISFMEYSSWGLQDLLHGIYIFYHYDQVIYLGTCRSRDFASRIVSHLAAHENAWMNTLPKYAEKKYKLSSLKEAVEYILEEFSIQLIHLPTFPSRSKLSEEEVVGLNEKIKKLLQLENELRFLLQPELNTKKQASSPSQRAEGKRKYSVRANQKGRPARNTTVAPVGSEKILVVNVGANLSPTELKEAAAGPWKISEIQKGTKIAAWNGEKIIAVWRLKGSQKEGHQYRLELGATITAVHAAPVSEQLGNKFRMFSRVMMRDYTPPKSKSASGTAERSSFYLTIDDGVLQLDVSEGERLLSSLRDEERAQIHTIQIQAFPNKALPPLGAFPNLKNMQIQRCENLTDLSVLQHLPQIEQFTLMKCPAVEDFSPLKALSSLSQVTLSDLEHFSDLSVLSNAKAMDVLEFDTLPKFVDLAPIQRFSNLSSLRIEGCTSVSDVSPIGGLAALSSLVMNDCPAHKSVSLFDLPRLKDVVLNDTIEEISYQNLPSLTEFSVSRLPNLKHVSLASMSGLQELRILDCPNLTRLQADDTCDQIQSMYVSACPSLSIDSVLSRQKNIRKLVLSSLESILEVPILKNGEWLTDLSLLCPNLSDLRGLSAYPNLTILGLSGSAVQDLSPIAGLKNLQELSLNDCSQIKDISPLGGLPKLCNRLYLNGCIGLKEISLSHSPIESISLDDCVEKISLHHCPNIQRLMLNRLPNLSSVSLSHLDALEQIDLRKTPRLLALTNFSSLPKLTTILLRECSALRDISGIQHLLTLSELDIKGCPELQEQALYKTLYTLPQLRTLKSEIPSNMLTQVMAVLAFQRNDASCIAENMDAWCFAVQQYPTTPGILSALASAASLLPDSASILVLLLDLASRHDVQKISVLFDVVESFLDEESVSQALASLIAQEERPLPPQTLCEYHRLFPRHTSLKEHAILAILRSLEAERIEDWTPRTQQKILETLHDAVSTETLMRVIDTLRGRSFRETEIYLFGIACNTVPLVSEESWRSKAFTELQAIAFQQKDYASLERSLSFLIQGISKSDDMDWVKTRIDEVLRQAADINPDTSVLRSACAEAQARFGRWEQAIQIAFEIANPGVHDKTLCALMDMALATHRVDRLNIAISMVAGISDYLRRREQLLLLQKEEALVEDMVAFGQVVQLLLDYPEELRSFVSDSVLRKSELGSVNLMTLQAHTDREQHLLSLRDQRWLEVIASEAPHLVDSLRTVMEL